MESTGIAAIQTAISGMASTVADSAMTTLANVLPVLAPLIGAIIVAQLGYSFVKRFSA